MENSYTVFLHSECLKGNALVIVGFFVKKKAKDLSGAPLILHAIGEAQFEMASALICEIKGV